MWFQFQTSRAFSFVYKILAQSEKSCKVDTATSILRKIQNPIKFEPLLRFRPNLKTKSLDLCTVIKKYLAENLNFAELEAKMPFLWKNQNFMKSERFDAFVPNSIPNVLEHWSLYKDQYPLSLIKFYPLTLRSHTGYYRPIDQLSA